jgi:hypothetical protein
VCCLYTLQIELNINIESMEETGPTSQQIHSFSSHLTPSLAFLNVQPKHEDRCRLWSATRLAEARAPSSVALQVIELDKTWHYVRIIVEGETTERTVLKFVFPMASLWSEGLSAFPACVSEQEILSISQK